MPNPKPRKREVRDRPKEEQEIMDLVHPKITNADTLQFKMENVISTTVNKIIAAHGAKYYHELLNKKVRESAETIIAISRDYEKRMGPIEEAIQKREREAALAISREKRNASIAKNKKLLKGE